MKIVSPIFFFLIIGLMSRGLCYEKIKYLTVNEKITAIANCKTINNLIFATQSGKLNLWISYTNMEQYDLPQKSANHIIQCSRYGNSAQKAFVAVLSGKTISIWQQIVQSTLYSYLVQKEFHQKNYSHPPSFLSVGQQYLAVGSKQESIVDIYNLNEPNELPISINLTAQLIFIRMDDFDSLAIIVYQNNSYTFFYHLSPDYQSVVLHEQFELGQSKNISSQVKLSMDYQMPKKQEIDSRFKTVFLISGPYQALFINYTQQNSLTKPQKIESNHSQMVRICDNTLSSSDGSFIWKQNAGNILEVSNPIIQFTCVRETGTFIDSFYFVVSSWQNQYYIDCFSISNWKVWLVLGICFIFMCCCGCLRICVKMREGERRQALSCINYYLCICPTEQAVQDIEQHLMK